MAQQTAIGQAASKVLEQPELLPESPQPGLLGRTRTWVLDDGPWWLCSFVFHLVLICSLALVGGKAVEKLIGDQPPAFKEAKVDPAPDALSDLEPIDIGLTPEDPSKSKLTTETLTWQNPGGMTPDERNPGDDSESGERSMGSLSSGNMPELSVRSPFDIKAVGPGPAAKGKKGEGGELSDRDERRKRLSVGPTGLSERAVAGALNWLARHQSVNGSWGLAAYKARCKDGTCSGPGKAGERPAAATALGLLPFLAAGQTHKSKGHYQKNIAAGIKFLISHQKSNGDLRIGTGGQMYDHGLAAIALCECYGMSNDPALRPRAQAALNFIADAQDTNGGGWRYEPHMPGDTSVIGWQLMALKSGQMAYLPVDPAVFERAKEFLKSVSYGGQYGSRFSYMPGRQSVSGDDRATTAIALLCHQYMHMPRIGAVMVEGTAYLMQNLPDAEQANLYYWYYATQVMHNQPGKDWDAWNRKMRRLLIDTQSKDGCAAGSWYSANGKDPWAEHGGRLMMTSLAALTLEVYYRYLPLYKLDTEPGGGNPPAEKEE